MQNFIQQAILETEQLHNLTNNFDLELVCDIIKEEAEYHSHMKVSDFVSLMIELSAEYHA